MSVKQIPNSLYGFPQPVNAQVFAPIVSKRNPAATDFAPIGALWVNTVTPAAYLLVQIAANVAKWILLEVGGGAGAFASLTVNPGPINLTGILTQLGTANINATGAAATNIATGTGALNIGNAVGAIAVGGTLNVTGSVLATLSLVSQASTVGAQLIATGDLGNGFVNELSLTSGTNVTQGAGALSILSTNGNAGNNAGFIKIYVGTTIAYLPFFTNIAP